LNDTQIIIIIKNILKIKSGRIFLESLKKKLKYLWVEKTYLTLTKKIVLGVKEKRYNSVFDETF